ncbi:MAG TPA: SsrA-binding protein, partial [Gemmatimonadales bacterium]|nr:SsrA-binding protein [Gemmatimonadales bacterium]
WEAVRQKGMTIVPTRVYLKDGRAKIEVAIAKGKKLHDKRQAIAQRDSEREAAREQNTRRE